MEDKTIFSGSYKYKLCLKNDQSGGKKRSI